MAFEIGSAINTPITPNTDGRNTVRGITIIAFLSNEKNTALLAQPRAVKVDWPENINAMKKKPKKYECSAGVPSFI